MCGFTKGVCVCFVLINKWFLRLICLTVDPTLRSIRVPREFSATHCPTVNLRLVWNDVLIHLCFGSVFKPKLRLLISQMTSPSFQTCCPLGRAEITCAQSVTRASPTSATSSSTWRPTTQITWGINGTRSSARWSQPAMVTFCDFYF